PAPRHLVDPQRRQPAEVPVRQAPFDSMPHRPADAVPRRPEDRGHLAPAQPLGPGRQEPAVGRSHLVLAVAPRHHLHPHPTPPTPPPPPPHPPAPHTAPPHPRGAEGDAGPRGRPDRNPPFLQAVIRRATAAAPGAERAAVLAGLDAYDQGRAVVPLLQAGLAV